MNSSFVFFFLFCLCVHVNKRIIQINGEVISALTARFIRPSGPPFHPSSASVSMYLNLRNLTSRIMLPARLEVVHILEFLFKIFSYETK